MSIRYKTLLIGLLSVSVIIGVTIVIFYFSYFGYINKENENRIKRDFTVVDHIIEKEEGNMHKLISDWGQWDDTYKFISKPNQEYIDSNLQDYMMENLNVEAMIFLDNNKNILYSKESNSHNGIGQEIVAKLLQNENNFNKTTSRGKVGMLSLKGNAYILGILPTTSSDRKAVSNGFLIMVSKIDENLTDYMEQIIPVELAFTEPQQKLYQYNEELVHMELDNSEIYYNKNNLQSSRIKEDISEQPLIEIDIAYKDHGNEQKIYFFYKFIFEFLTLIVVLIIFDSMIINRYILKRLLKVTNFMEGVAKTKDTSLVINISGKDEINKLADTTNKMLSAINSANKEILFLSYHDKLTNLNNRAYMERLFNELDNNKEKNYFVIVADINGLKLVNDALGRLEGNKVLFSVGKIFKEICDKDDEICRLSGDEFVILIKNKGPEYVPNLIDEIKYRCANELEFHFEISIAFGYAGWYEDSSGAEAVMNLAEERMYRNKLTEDKSVRSSTINSLLKTLHEKHSETEEHTLRIKNLGVKLGKKIGLTKEKLDELVLLSSLHDMGKIGIPEHILMKKGKLTEEEWIIMKTHSNIGYRIAASIPELDHIANEILAHHERYDGTGYPNNLKGEEIPLLSRIISIVDSFDAMIHKRVYKEAFNKEYAISELKRCSGTQFDPVLVKEFISLLEEEHFC